MTTLRAPAGRTGVIHSRNGGVFHILDGLVEVESRADVADLERAGFSIFDVEAHAAANAAQLEIAKDALAEDRPAAEGETENKPETPAA